MENITSKSSSSGDGADSAEVHRDNQPENDKSQNVQNEQDPEDLDEPETYNDSDIRITWSQHGKPKLFLKDFSYHIHYKGKTYISWRCDAWRKCRIESFFFNFTHFLS